MKRYKLHLLFPIVLISLVLIASGCFYINMPDQNAQQPSGGGQQTGVPVINNFSANPANISAGGSSTLSWQVTGATSVSISPDLGNVALSGSTAVSPNEATSYLLTATNSAGSITAVAQVSVEAASAPPSSPGLSLPVIESFAADPASILIGGSSTLSWEVANASSVKISPGIGVVATTGSKSISPAATTTYTLTAANSAGWRSKSITVTASNIKLLVPMTVLAFMVPFEDKTWVLDQYGPSGSTQDAIAGKEVSAKFDSGSGKVGGSSGCNTYTANYQRDVNKVTVTNMMGTLMSCPMPAGIMAQESAFKNALSNAISCKMSGGKLIITCSGDRVLIFHQK